MARYQSQGCIGKGAMGVVHRAWDSRGHCYVAIKTIRLERTSRLDRVRRMKREARALARISHRNVVQVIDGGVFRNGFYLAMEYVKGRTLAQALGDGPFEGEETASIGAQLADGLSAVHLAGVVHRDIKPSNVMVDTHGTAKIMDFGLANLTNDHDATLLTTTGALLGTPAYLPPESFADQPHDERGDVYQLGLVLYEILTGTRALYDATLATLISGVAYRNIVDLRLRLPTIDDGLATIVHRALAIDRDARYESASQLRDALIVWLELQGSRRLYHRQYDDACQLTSCQPMAACA